DHRPRAAEGRLAHTRSLLGPGPGLDSQDVGQRQAEHTQAADAEPFATADPVAEPDWTVVEREHGRNSLQNRAEDETTLERAWLPSPPVSQRGRPVSVEKKTCQGTGVHG